MTGAGIVAITAIAAGLAGVVLFAVTGLALTELFPGLRTASLFRRLAYSYPLGVAWIAGGLYALSHCFAVPLGRPTVLALALPVLAAALTWRRLRPPVSALTATSATRRPRDRFLVATTALAVVVAAGVSLAVFAEAASEPVSDWDGRMTWVPQARFVRSAGTVDAPVLREPQWFVTHPRYPLLLPLAQGAVLDLTGGGERDSYFRFLYAAFFPAFLLLVYAGSRRWGGRQAAALALLTAALIPFVAFSPEGGAVAAYSDLPLACFYGAGLLLLIRLRPRPSDGLAAGILLAGAVLAKREGTFLAVAALLFALLPIDRPLGSWWRPGPRGRTWSRLAPAGWASLVVVAAFALVLSWSATIPQRYDEGYEQLIRLRAMWPAAITRLPLLLPVLRQQMFSAYWGLFWWAAPFVFLVGRKALLRRRIALPFLLAVASPLAVVWAAYAVIDHPVALAMVTWNRFLLHASVPLFVLLAVALRELLHRVRRRVPAPLPSL